ncbi:MAG: DUF2059 domain-containing protein [Candidatus Omnitrophica bacterium]|nr:DUF2059 domain-containing protein [Candidatus Omnitrophota bacterium]
MSLRILVLFALIALIPVTAHAEILIMKDGRSINAKILNRDSKKIKIEENGRTVTYFLDQVQSINGKPLADWEEESAEEDATPADSGTTPAPAKAKPISITKLELIKKFIDIFGTRQSMVQNFERMLAGLPPDQSKEVRKILNVDEIIDNIVPLYDKYFTQQELETYVDFYTSPQGQKFLTTIPMIMKESVDVNIEYFKTRLPKEAK